MKFGVFGSSISGEVGAGLRRLGFCCMLPMGCAFYDGGFARGHTVVSVVLSHLRMRLTATPKPSGMLMVRGYSVLFGQLAARSQPQFIVCSTTDIVKYRLPHDQWMSFKWPLHWVDAVEARRFLH